MLIQKLVSTIIPSSSTNHTMQSCWENYPSAQQIISVFELTISDKSRYKYLRSSAAQGILYVAAPLQFAASHVNRWMSRERTETRTNNIVHNRNLLSNSNTTNSRLMGIRPCKGEIFDSSSTFVGCQITLSLDQR